MTEKFSERWHQWRAEIDLDEYDRRWDDMAASGQAVHGEADFVSGYVGKTVLDAGCGMGRVGIELANRGRQIVGVDYDDAMLAYARRRRSDLDWRQGDLATISLGQKFDLIVAAGNVLIFVEPSDRVAAVNNMVRHLSDDGRLITGANYAADFSEGLSLADFDAWCTAAGLGLAERFAGWDRAAYDGGDYAVSVHSRQSAHPG